MKSHTMLRGLLPLGCLVLVGSMGFAQDSTEGAPKTSFDEAANSIQSKLEASLEQLVALQEQIAAEKVPLSKRLAELEIELAQVRAESTGSTRGLQESTLGLANLTTKIANRRNEVEYLARLLDEYVSNFDAGLHIAEVAQYAEPVQAALLAPENDNLTTFEVFEAQAKILDLSIDRMFESMGGTRFDGTAVDPTGIVRDGTYVMIGPAGLFRSKDGSIVGTAETQLNSAEAAVVPFHDPLDTEAANGLVVNGNGFFPLDPSLGDAHRTAQTEITVRQEIEKGGAVMWPILVMAGAALLVALLKWIHLLFFPKPSGRKVRGLLEAVANGDTDGARQRVTKIRGPAGRMLTSGVANMHRPPELVEELMYEDVLSTRLSAQRFLPFIAICATSAPLLGLLGTVTGIINTFKLITVYGSGDVKTLSGGISEALITTKYGLVVAIPALLLHAFLWRKARGITGRMESVAMSFVNEVSKTSGEQQSEEHAEILAGVTHRSESDLVRRQVSEILGEMLGTSANGVPAKSTVNGISAN